MPASIISVNYPTQLCFTDSKIFISTTTRLAKLRQKHSHHWRTWLEWRSRTMSWLVWPAMLSLRVIQVNYFNYYIDFAKRRGVMIRLSLKLLRHTWVNPRTQVKPAGSKIIFDSHCCPTRQLDKYPENSWATIGLWKIFHTQNTWEIEVYNRKRKTNFKLFQMFNFLNMS